MAPLPLSFDIHTDLWGNHRVGDPSIPQIVGGFFTDMWGSHRGVSVPATKEGIVRRSSVYRQGFMARLVVTFKMMPVWWYFLFGFTILWFCFVTWAICTGKFREGGYKVGQNLPTKGAGTSNKGGLEDGEDKVKGNDRKGEEKAMWI